MAKNSVLSRPHVSQSQGRHAFDRSFIRNFTQSAGMITPVMFEPCLAGTKGKINRKVFTRSAQVLAPAFPAVKMNFDFFKIPIRFLWSKWNDFKLNINDLNSSALTSLMTSGAGNPAIDGVVPRFDFTNYVAENLNRLISSYQSALPSTGRALILNDAMRLLEPLYGLQGGALVGGSSSLGANVKSLFALAAYQKVYYDHYRNTAYEQNNPYAYNLDWLQNMSTPNLFAPTSQQEYLALRNMLTLRYVNYRNDYYKNIYPSLNYTSSVPDGTSWLLPSNLVGASTNSNSNLFRVSNNVGNNGVSINQLAQNLQNYPQYVTVQSIRAAFALDKLLRASAYTPKHVKDQIKARFGVDVGDKVSFESQRLGSFDNDIIFGEVTNQSKSALADLGAVGGKGIGASNFEKDIDFYCEEDSIILGVSYILPRAIYDCQPDEWSDRLIREDFYQPEFENLGLRPLYGRPGQPNYITGYTVPHQRLKLGRDFNLGEFKETAEHYTDDGSGNLIQQSYSGVLSSYTIHSQFDYTGSSAGVGYGYFKCVPSDLDAIFAYSYPADGHQQDHFFSHLEIKFNVVSSMSYHGQPFM